MKTFLNISVVLLVVLFFAACSSKEDHSNHDHSDMDKNHKLELVREGTIDVESIDVNEDGKIYECPMDWNVLDDEKGNCPTCGMHLKEFSVEEVKSNLNKYGYEYKK